MCKEWHEKTDDGIRYVAGPCNKFLLDMDEEEGKSLYKLLLHFCNWTDEEIRHYFTFSWKELDSCLMLLKCCGLSYGTSHRMDPIHFHSPEELKLKLAIRGL